MSSDEIATIGSFLDSHGTLTIATQGSAGPWAASLFFARDDQLNLYFVSSLSARHVKDLLVRPSVAVTVNADFTRWKDICGLQISGTAELVDRKSKSDVADLYLQKFGEIRQLLAKPSGAAEKTIAEKFMAGAFFRVQPQRIRFIDNTRGFGHSTEYDFVDRRVAKDAL